MADKEFYIEIYSDPNKLPEIEDFLQDISQDLNINKTQLTNLMIAVNEATTNGMLHGNKMDSNKKVKLRVLAESDKIKVIIKDEGKGFDPKSVPDPTDSDNIFKESGRGLYIMRTCMNEVNYAFSPDGTELTLVMEL